MALDKDGRPIPVELPPPPPDYWAAQNADQAQFNLVAEKTDAVLMTVADHGQRISMLEQTGGDRLNAALLDFEQRFDAMMLAKMQNMEKQFEALASVAALASRAPPPDEPTTLPTPRRR